MSIRTRVFDLYANKYSNLAELAQAMGLSVSQVYRVRDGKRRINEKFIIGAKKAFPEYRLDDLFFIEQEPPSGKELELVVNRRYNHIVREYTRPTLIEV